MSVCPLAPVLRAGILQRLCSPLPSPTSDAPIRKVARCDSATGHHFDIQAAQHPCCGSVHRPWNVRRASMEKRSTTWLLNSDCTPCPRARGLSARESVSGSVSSLFSLGSLHTSLLLHQPGISRQEAEEPAQAPDLCCRARACGTHLPARCMHFLSLSKRPHRPTNGPRPAGPKQAGTELRFILVDSWCNCPVRKRRNGLKAENNRREEAKEGSQAPSLSLQSPKSPSSSSP